jgi:hypothetical protein
MDHLLVVSVERVAATAVMVRTVWATTGDLLAGHRRTDVDLVADQPALRDRLAALAPRLFPPAAAVQTQGSATMVPDPDDLAPAAGDLPAAA